VHHPDLALLNKGEFKSPVSGNAGILNSDGVSIQTPFELRNDLDPLAAETEAGVEFQWRMTQRQYLLFGLATWEGSSQSITDGHFPMQGVDSQLLFDRRGDLSYNQFFLGWKYNLFHKPRRYSIYPRLALNELFDIDYKEDLTFFFLDGPAATFRRIIIMESQATGVLLFQAGMGFEYYFTSWFSLAFDADYAFQPKKMRLSSNRIRSDIQATDGIFNLNLPTNPDAAGRLAYLSQDGSEYHDLKLGFDGWKALLHFNINF